MTERRNRWPVLAAAVICLFCTPLAAVAGTIRITVKRSTPPYRYVVAKAYRLAPDVESYSWRYPGPGTFAQKVPGGLYAVVVTTQTARKQGSSVRILKVPGARAAAADRSALAAVAAGVRMSVGGVVLTNPAGVAQRFPNGSPLYVDSIVVTDMVQYDPDCEIGVFEDRKFGRFREVVQELKLQTTEAFPASTRALAKRALANLKSYAPQYRLSGSIPAEANSFDLAGGTAHFVLTDTRTGEVLWSMSYPVTPGTGLFDMPGSTGLSPLAAFLAGRALCNEPPVPTTISGEFWGNATSVTYLNQLIDWDGMLSFKISSLIRANPARPRRVTSVGYTVPDPVDFTTSHTVSGECSAYGSARSRPGPKGP